ncbi:MAG: hypothetical protein AAB250_04075 [Bdellovibrionota bacterium]
MLGRSLAILTFAATLVGVIDPAFAGLPGFCGTMDISKMENAAIENVIMINDLTKGRKIRRGQCGLPGEKLNICSACSETTSEPAMRILRPMVGERSHLAWHADWHELRGTIEPLSPFVFNEAKKAQLVPSNWTFDDFKSKYAIEGGTLAGENFFFMHRLMIKMVQLELAGNGQPCFAPWRDIPSSVDDPQWPTPKRFATPFAKAAAQAQLEGMQAQLLKLRAPKLLKNVSLNRLGQLIEPRLHMQLHGFFRSGPACSPEARAQGFCDDLVPVQSSPLNKHFWKIHGLVDQLIGDWLRAHDYREISVKCDGRPGCYQWQGTWIGRYPRGGS